MTMPQEEAERQVKALKEIFKRNKHIKQQEIYTDMRRVYGHMQHGGKVLDIYQVFKNCDLDEDGNPKIAICRADAHKCYLGKNGNGSAIFSYKPFPNSWAFTARKSYKDVELPSDTFDWIPQDPHRPIGRWNIKNQIANTIVPIIPAPILVEEVKLNLYNYQILWEVEEWKPDPPKDPILLKKLTPNLYGVLATWNLTELERAIIRAHIIREEV